MSSLSSIKILGKTYSIEFVPKEVLPNDYGESDSEQQVIKVRSDLHIEHQADVLLHEVIHAIDFAVNGKMTERQVHTIATGLLAVIFDNPTFMELLWSMRTIPKG